MKTTNSFAKISFCVYVVQIRQMQMMSYPAVTQFCQKNNAKIKKRKTQHELDYQMITNSSHISLYLSLQCDITTPPINGGNLILHLLKSELDLLLNDIV